MFNALKKYLDKKHFRDNGWQERCNEDGVGLRELTLEEIQALDFGNFGARLSRAGLLPNGYHYTPKNINIVSTGAKEGKINYVNLTFDSSRDKESIKVNIKDFDVSTAKGESLVYQYSKGMSQVWLDLCCAYLWYKQVEHKQPFNKVVADSCCELDNCLDNLK